MNGLSPDELAEAARWRVQADEELRISRVLAREDLPARAACFHAHLAAEKALKALMILRGIEVQRIHHLRRLADTLPAADRALFDDGDLDLLNPWTIDGRYPADLIDAGPEVVRDVISAAERLVGSVVLPES
jgi:HEPN domain-containing protein